MKKMAQKSSRYRKCIIVCRKLKKEILTSVPAFLQTRGIFVFLVLKMQERAQVSHVVSVSNLLCLVFQLNDSQVQRHLLRAG